MPGWARAWQLRLAENPLLASRVGDRRFDGQLGRVGVAEERRRTGAAREFLAELQQIEAGALAGQDLISYEMFERRLRDAIGDFEHRDYYLPLTVDSGFHTWFASLPRFAPRRTVADLLREARSARSETELGGSGPAQERPPTRTARKARAPLGRPGS